MPPFASGYTANACATCVEPESLLPRLAMAPAGGAVPKEAGRHFNLTRERVRQLEARAFAQLRESPEMRSLLEYLENGQS